MRPPWLVMVLAATTGLAGCSESVHQGEASPSPRMVSAPKFHRSEHVANLPSENPAINDAPPAPPPWTTKPEVAEDDPPIAEEEPDDEPETLPNVVVRNIGMHIGGGPNDATTKAPIRQAVRPHYDDFRRCYAKITKPKQKITFGVDIRIGRKGGVARISNPRSGFRGKEAAKCMVEVFEDVEFSHPPSGKPTNVSFSLGFTKI